MGLYLLIPLSVVLVFIIGVIFWWSVRSGQYDDMEGPAYRLLLEDRDSPQPGPEEGEKGGTEDVEAANDEQPRGRPKSVSGADADSET